MPKSFFGRLFDFNDDGEVDEAESAAELLYLESFDGEDVADDGDDDDADVWDDDEDVANDEDGSDWED